MDTRAMVEIQISLCFIKSLLNYLKLDGLALPKQELTLLLFNIFEHLNYLLVENGILKIAPVILLTLIFFKV